MNLVPPAGAPLSHEVYVARLQRARAWHLREAGRQRFVAQEAVARAVAETQRHDEEVRRLDDQLAGLGATPTPPETAA